MKCCFTEVSRSFFLAATTNGQRDESCEEERDTKNSSHAFPVAS